MSQQEPSRLKNQGAPQLSFTQALRERWTGPFTPMANARARSTDRTVVPLLILRENGEYDADVTRDYEEMRDEAAKLSRFFRTISPSPHVALSKKAVADMLGCMIWGSNIIEGVGVDLETTLNICDAIFRGRTRTFRNTKLRPSFLKAALEAIELCFQKHRLPRDASSIRHCLLEVVNHALAAMHIINHVVLDDEDLDVEVITETYNILTEGLENGEDPNPCYSHLHDGYHCNRRCDHGASFHKDIEGLALHLQHDVRTAVEAGRMDPVTLAAKYGQYLYCLQGLYGGDKRLSRLIMNALLLKYGGMVVAVGAGVQNRDEYLDVATKEKEGVKLCRRGTG